MNTSPTTIADWLCHLLSLASSSEPEASTSPLRTLTPSKTSTPSSPFSWPDLLRLAQRHSVAPLLYHRLKTNGIQEQVPPDIFQALHEAPL